jgi:nucleotide-binding universal stress UspA family protein
MIKRILVPVDFSDVSLEAVDYAAEFGKPFRAELIVLFVVEPIHFATPADLYGPAANMSMLIEEQRRAAREQLERLSAGLKKRRIKHRALLQTGTAYQGIVDTAKRQKVDLIIMTTHGRTGLSHLVLGSVAERVVRTAACPVLTLRGSAKAAKKKTRKAPAKKRKPASS